MRRFNGSRLAGTISYDWEPLLDEFFSELTARRWFTSITCQIAEVFDFPPA